jgi:tetratricopeptide (TPR) repeat protein
MQPIGSPHSPSWRAGIAVVALLWTSSSVLALAPTPAQRRTLALADSLHAASAVDSAQAVLAAAISIARAAADSSYLTELSVRQGAQLAAFGRYREAEPLLREALVLAEAGRDTQAVCQVLRWLALAVSSQGRHEEAEPLTRRQLRLATAIGSLRLVGWAQVAWGWYAAEHGQPAAAADAYREAIGAFRRAGDGRGEAWALNNLGIALGHAGDHDGERAAYEAAITRAGEVGHAMVEAMAANNLATLEYAWGDPGRAEARFRQASSLLHALGHAVEAVRTGLNVGICLMARGRLPEAAARLDSLAALAAAQSDAPLRAQVLVTLGNLRRLQGRSEAAKALWREIVTDPLDVGVENRIEAATQLADVMAEQDSVAVALALLEARRDLLRDREGSIRWRNYECLRGDLLVRAGRRDEGLALLRRVASASADQGADTGRIAALAALARAYERTDPDSSRAILVRAMDAWERVRDVPRTPEWREARGAEGARVHTEWARQELAAGGSLAGIFARLQRYKARTLLERMLGPGTGREGARGCWTTGLASLEAAQAIVAPDELLLDIYIGPDTSLVLAVTAAGCRAVPWPPASQLVRDVGFFRDLHLVPTVTAVTADEATALRRTGGDLGDRLLSALAPELSGRRRILVCPDGPANLLPWASLVVPGEDGAPQELAALEIVSVPSVTILNRLRTRTVETAPTDTVLALLGDPHSATIPAARDEVAWLTRTLAHVATMTDTAAADPTAWPAAAVLHVAAHVRPHDDSPWRSEIVLGSAADATPLTAARLAGLDLEARLAVLAGCESAGGRVLSGEGIQGLTGALLSAGVPVVAATLWPVDDRTTRDFVRLFYDELASGRTVSAGVRNARIALRDRPATRHPFHWAGYVVVGDGDVTIDLEPRERRRTTILLIAAAVIGTLVVIRQARRRFLRS